MKKNFWNKKKILITGSSGFVGKNLKIYLKKYLKSSNYKILEPERTELDLLDKDRTEFYFKKHKPDLVIHLAGKVGGINANKTMPATFYYENNVINTNLLHSCYLYKVKKVVSLGAGCAYADNLKQPLNEKDLWHNKPNENLIGYSISKRLISLQSELYHKQYNLNSIILLPANIYGPFDNFNEKFSSVMPSMIKKVIDAKNKKSKSVEVWGDGSASREFIYIDDLCEIIIEAMENITGCKTINVGSGEGSKIRTLIYTIIKLSGYDCKVKWNKKMPVGQKNRLFNLNLFHKNFKFRNFTSLSNGIKKTIDWYSENFND